MIQLLITILAAESWGPPAIVMHDEKPCVTYRALHSGARLAVSVKLEPGWHTFTMDNDKRATAKLNGKKALSADRPTSIQAEGLNITGTWMQPEPKDFSQPELRIFSWGYEDQALFVAPANVAGEGPHKVRIKAQACTKTVCKNIDLLVEVARQKSGDGPSTAGLIAVLPNSLRMFSSAHWLRGLSVFPVDGATNHPIFWWGTQRDRQSPSLRRAKDRVRGRKGIELRAAAASADPVLHDRIGEVRKTASR